MPAGTVFGLVPFVPKRILVLPSEGGEITLYVLDGKVYPTTIREPGVPPQRVVHSVHFSGWFPSYSNETLSIPEELMIDRDGPDFDYCEIEVVFRLVSGRCAEVVAISFDGCQTFYENTLCTLPSEYEPSAG